MNLLRGSKEYQYRGLAIRNRINGIKQPNKQVEFRKGTTLTRFRIANSYRYVFEEAGKRIVNREVKNLRKEIKKQLGERAIDTFKVYLSDFYRDFQDYIIRQIKPAVSALAEAITPLAQDQVGTRAKPAPLDKFLDEYSKTFAYRYAKSSQGQLNALLEEFEAE